MIEVSLKNVKKSYGINDILSDVSFDVKTGEVVGIVGENGAGKTTIFRLIKKIETEDCGNIDVAFKDSVGYLEQIPVYPDEKTVEEVLKDAFEKINNLECEIKKYENIMSKETGDTLDKTLRVYDKLLSEYEALDGYSKEVNYNKICNGLGFKTDFLNKKFNLLSGGEKTVALLGKTLLENNKILLLDEPTNHLDINMVIWLEEYIKEYKGTILIISHDRYFLDKVASKIIEIEDGSARTYEGNYSSYKKQKEDEIQRQYELYKTQQKKIKAMEEAIRRLKDFGNACHGDKNPFFKRAFNMEKRLEKMDKVDRVKERKQMKINITYEDRSGNEVINLDNIYKSFKCKDLLIKSNLLITYGERVALIGENGSGKSTLIKMLLGKENVDKGKITIGSNVKIAYLEQNVTFDNLDQTILEYFREDFVITEDEARSYLAKFLFFGEEVFKKINKLSGGEKSKLRLAKMLYSPNNLLILDEPTNHLDIDSREQIEEMLEIYKGTILFISHDRYFINKIAGKIVELENKKLNVYNGNYEYYLDMKAKELPPIQKEESKKTKVNNKSKEKKSSKVSLTEVRRLETKIGKLEKDIEYIENEMIQNSTNYQYLQELFEKKQNLDNELNILMEQWILIQ